MGQFKGLDLGLGGAWVGQPIPSTHTSSPTLVLFPCCGHRGTGPVHHGPQTSTWLQVATQTRDPGGSKAMDPDMTAQALDITMVSSGRAVFSHGPVPHRCETCSSTSPLHFLSHLSTQRAGLWLSQRIVLHAQILESL